MSYFSPFLKSIIFISLGFILFLMELFTPGFGLPGIVGILFILGGCFLLLKESLILGVIALIVSLVLVVLFFKFFKRSLFWKRIRLDAHEAKGEGFRAQEDLSYLVEKTGISLTPLKPTGIALIEGGRIDVSAEGLYIEKGKKIKVVALKDNQLIVREEK